LKIIKVLTELGADLSIPKYATHLVYMTNANRVDEIEEKSNVFNFAKKDQKSRYWFT
jgi:KUP system potassium uptake protein